MIIITQGIVRSNQKFSFQRSPLFAVSNSARSIAREKGIWVFSRHSVSFLPGLNAPTVCYCGIRIINRYNDTSTNMLPQSVDISFSRNRVSHHHDDGKAAEHSSSSSSTVLQHGRLAARPGFLSVRPQCIKDYNPI